MNESILQSQDLSGGKPEKENTAIVVTQTDKQPKNKLYDNKTIPPSHKQATEKPEILIKRGYMTTVIWNRGRGEPVCPEKSKERMRKGDYDSCFVLAPVFPLMVEPFFTFPRGLYGLSNGPGVDRVVVGNSVGVLK